MAKPTTPIKALSRFVQLLDGNFPSGGFVHSYGLEAHVVLEQVTTSDTLETYLHNVVQDQYRRFEFPFVNRVFQCLETGNLGALVKADNRYSAMQHQAFAAASVSIGRNYLRHIGAPIETPAVQAYFDAVAQGQSRGNELAVLGAYAFELGLDRELFLLLWCKKSLMALTLASLKITRIRPSDIQQILFRIDEAIEASIDTSSVTVENFNPLFEEIVYRHPYLEPKLFMT